MNARLLLSLSVCAAAAFSAGCAAGAASRSAYAEKPAAELVRAIDEKTYSPAAAGLRRLEADLLVDIAGFIPSEKRPKEAVVVPVRFVWAEGRGAFSAGAWPKAAEPLKQRILDLLKGKEDDFVARSYQDRLAELRVAVTEAEGTLVLAAQQKSNDQRRTYLYVNEQLLVGRMTVIDGDLRVDSILSYQGTPAVLTKAESRIAGPQATVTDVEITYGKAGKYVLPSKLTYRTTVGATVYPPLTIEVKNVKTGSR